ncbi:unnamed protein product [Cylindrotheca closterium]|uniref:UvrD-like helicase ATP-binding domain-containing protein n=1 Tax=Cylindrotheca closterium TaxID=2856 RepID=A0AAD2JPT2_9STRA|nr:unnamed protein product [Cylindrotheca closterium]
MTSRRDVSGGGNHNMGQRRSGQTGFVNIGLEQRLFSLWEKSMPWYLQPMVLHSHPSHADVSSYEQLADFVGVYLPEPPQPGEEYESPFPAYIRNKHMTHLMFVEYRGFSRNEKDYRRNQGDWLNEAEYFEDHDVVRSPYQQCLVMNQDFSLLVRSENGYEGTLVRTKRKPPKPVPMLSKSFSTEKNSTTQYHASMEDMYDEWKLIDDETSRILGRKQIALTPLKLFLEPKTFPTDTLSEYALLSSPALALRRSDEFIENQNEGSAPEGWLQTLEGVYCLVKGFVYNTRGSRLIGWRRMEGLTNLGLSSNRPTSNTDRDLCLYFDDVSKQFAVRPFDIGCGELHLFELCPPELASTKLPSREHFDPSDQSKNIASLWTAHLCGEGHFSIPFELAPVDYFLKRGSEQKFNTNKEKIAGRETGCDTSLTTDLNELTGETIKGSVEESSGSAKKKRKRKKKRKKKKTMAESLSATDTDVQPSIEQLSVEVESEAALEQPTLDLKTDDVIPVKVDPHPSAALIGNSSAISAEEAKEPKTQTDELHPSNHYDNHVRLSSNDRAIDNGYSAEHGCNELDFSKSIIQHDETPMDLTSTLQRLCEWLDEELSRSPYELNKCELGDLVGFEEEPSIATISNFLFQTTPHDSGDLYWLRISETTTSSIFCRLLSSSDIEASRVAEWIQATAGDLLLKCVDNCRTKDVFALLNCDEATDWFREEANSVLRDLLQKDRLTDIIDLMSNHKAVPFIETNLLCQILGTLPTRRGGSELGNSFAKAIWKVRLESTDDKKIVTECMSNKLSKDAARRVMHALKKGMQHLKRQLKAEKQKAETIDPAISDENTPTELAPAASAVRENDTQSAQESIKHFQLLIDDSIKSHAERLRNLKSTVTNGTRIQPDQQEIDDTGTLVEAEDQAHSVSSVPPPALSPTEIAAAMARCATLDQKEAEEIVNRVEMSLDLSNWSTTSEWVVEITEQAHKWFRKRSKKQYGLCERVVRRMQLLSTGRWPYVLCKPVRTSKSVSINLYESKIDSGSRILWEVAVSFSPRRSREGEYFGEQVIRVWDIVVNHDALTTAIDQAVERAVDRIEKSHIRGEKCQVFTELDGYGGSVENNGEKGSQCITQRIPKVFQMKQGVKGLDVPTKAVYYAPANDDEKQYNLLKFYEMNAEAVGLLLDGDVDNADLPFTPGPQEHEIIHFNPNPKRSLLLQGRSGTGKTTCLVFRMWAEGISLAGSNDDDMPPRQLFLTKNDVLRREVERSFKCMGLAWRKRHRSTHQAAPMRFPDDENSNSITFPLFLTSSEWLDILDGELSGERFFSSKELETRISARLKDDTAQRGLEEFFDNTNRDTSGERDSKSGARKEMTFSRFCTLWSKINSKTKSKMAPDQVWLEIKSHIKGSVAALHLEDAFSSSHIRFLSRDEYLSLPRKQSRLDQPSRQEVFDLYERYEKMKKGKYYDEMDIVYHLAHRIPPRQELKQLPTCPIPVDAVYVDEVQDFTQSELLLLARLCNDSNSLMLAGDTAQSITAGVWFRFADVRQLFYGQFGGDEPRLQKLTHNYRSHSGILHLAAAVVELLYHFFQESLDRLPPDFGLFPGPKPVAMVVSSVEDLVLMLDGSKRETSRIEFGAHQVVLVRNEEAKQHLPEEFGVDKDWVMTVQESKGLEFDDVLVLNFFQDSPAGDSWRVISNYGLEQAKSYYDECESGSQTFQWEDISATQQTRPLAFDSEQHKTLETELKILYTAITRARVNVFIAEMDSSLCQPMFNYFRRRKLVEFVYNDDGQGLSSLPVFGQIDTVDEWKARGQYYLNSAGGHNENIAALRLAARCFEKAGETTKMERALAYAAFLRIERQETEGPKKKKRGTEKRLERYRIALNLLETGDTEFLVKAGLCLVRTGSSEFGRVAKMLDTHSSIRYATRVLSDHTPNKRPSADERRNFSYASQLYFSCISGKDRSVDERSQLMVDCFRCCVSSWEENDLERALSLLDSNSRLSSNVILDLASVWSGTETEYPSPISYWISDIGKNSGASRRLQESMTKTARIACRQCHIQNNRDGLSRALSVISTRKERIQLLSSLETNAESFLLKCKWSSEHPAFCTDAGPGTFEKQDKLVDVTDLLLNELLGDDDFDGAAKLLSQRGQLLRAADCIGSKRDVGSKNMAISFKILHIELIQGCPSSGDKDVDLVSQQLSAIVKEYEGTGSGLLAETKLGLLLAQARHTNKVNDWETLVKAADGAFILWKLDIWFSLLEVAAESPIVRKLDSYLTIDSLLKMGKEIQDIISHLRDGTSTDGSAVAAIHSFFRLEVSPLDPDLVLTAVVTNWRLRTAMKKTGIKLSPSALASKALMVPVNAKQINHMLALYCCHLSIDVLNRVQEQIKPTIVQRISGAISIAEPSDLLQFRLYCFEEMKTIANLGLALEKQKSSLWGSKLYEIEAGRNSALSDFWNFINSYVGTPVHYSEDASKVGREGCITIKGKPILDCLRNFALSFWYDLPQKQRKTSFEEVLKLWRALDICLQASDRSVELFGKKLNSAEHLQDAQRDYEKNNMHHFIKSKTKIKAKKVTAVKTIFRMWKWALESAKTNLFNSITLVERLIKETSERKTLKTLPMQYQISLLETNCVALLAMISYRYSESGSKKIWLALPEKRYIEMYLVGDSGTGNAFGRGFGIRLLDTIHSIEKKDVTFTFFNRFLLHFEILADTIRDLLSSEKEDIECLVRCITLGFCILYNAIMLAHGGKSMGRSDIENDLNTLPRIPTSANILRLALKLREVLSVLQKTPNQWDISDAKQVLHESSTALELFKLVHRVFEASTRDRLVLFGIERDATNGSCAMIRNETSAFTLIANTIGAFEATVIERASAEATGDMLLALLSNDPFPTKDLLSKNYRNHHTGETDEVLIASSYGERQEAARKIQRLLCNRHYKTADANYANKCIDYFRKWKMAMVIQQQIRLFLARKKETSAKSEIIPEPSGAATTGTRHPLASIPNRWADMGFVRDQQLKWQSSLHSRSPFFFDDAECVYCGLTFCPEIAESRRQWCQINFPEMSYKSSSQTYNQQFFQEQILFSRGVGARHLKLDRHEANQNLVHHTLDQLILICARVDIGGNMLQQAIDACESESRRGGTFVSWYLSRKEEFYNKYSTMMSMLQQMQQLCIQGNIQQLCNSIDYFKTESFVPQSFLTEKRNEEKQIMLEADEIDSESIHDGGQNHEEEGDSEEEDYDFEMFLNKGGKKKTF